MQNSITVDVLDINSNSLDFVGIIAALDVMVAHTSVYIIGNGSGASIPLWRVIAPGPAVVAFFTISGFLTLSSYEHSKNVLKYYAKRIARIYPALICAIVLPIVIYSLSGSINIEPGEFVGFFFQKSDNWQRWWLQSFGRYWKRKFVDNFHTNSILYFDTYDLFIFKKYEKNMAFVFGIGFSYIKYNNSNHVHCSSKSIAKFI